MRIKFELHRAQFQLRDLLIAIHWKSYNWMTILFRNRSMHTCNKYVGYKYRGITHGIIEVYSLGILTYNGGK